VVVAKPEWKSKIKDAEIIAKWKAESNELGVREEVFEYAIKELEWLTKVGDPTAGIEPTGVEFVWVSLHQQILLET
jgi:hypothetical protein